MLVLIDVIKTETLSFSAKTIWGQSRDGLDHRRQSVDFTFASSQTIYRGGNCERPPLTSEGNLDTTNSTGNIRFPQVPGFQKSSGRSRVAWNPVARVIVSRVKRIDTEIARTRLFGHCSLRPQTNRYVGRRKEDGKGPREGVASQE